MDVDAPLRCVICRELLDEDPRDRDPTLVRPPNVHRACLEQLASDMAAAVSVHPVDLAGPSDNE